MELSSCLCKRTCWITSNYLSDSSWTNYYDLCMRILWSYRMDTISWCTFSSNRRIYNFKCILIFFREILWRELFWKIWYVDWNRKNRTQIFKKMSRNLGSMGNYSFKISPSRKSFSSIYSRIYVIFTLEILAFKYSCLYALGNIFHHYWSIFCPVLWSNYQIYGICIYVRDSCSSMIFLVFQARGFSQILARKKCWNSSKIWK